MMTTFLHWLSSGLSIGAVGAAVAFVISIFQFLAVRKRESNQQEFDKYHWLIERLVQPNEKGQVFLDKQIAVVFDATSQDITNARREFCLA